MTEDVDESLYIGAADILSPRTDVPWIVDPTGASGQPLPLDHTLFRIVSNNYFVMSPEQQSATEWEGDSILGFVDRFENNTVCMRAPDTGTTAMSLELRAPMIDGTGHNTQFVDTFEGEECVTTGVEVVVPTDVNIPEFTVGECSDDMRRFLACNCGQKDSVPLTATEVDIAGSRNAALEALCTDSDSGEVATSTWLQFEASVSPFLSTAEYLAESLDACVAPWEPRTTLQCWEDVEEMRWRALVPEQQLNDARDRWRSVARSSALWGFPASRYPSLDSAETSVLRTWVDRVEEQGE